MSQTSTNTTSATVKSGRLITPPGPLSYPKVFVPQLPNKPKPEDKKSYSTDYLLTRAALNSPEIKAIIAASKTLIHDEWGPGEMSWQNDYLTVICKTGKKRLPIRKDIAGRGYPEDIVAFFSARSKENPNYPPPQIIAVSGRVITDPREIYPGVIARVSIDPYVRRQDENPGVSFGLGNVQKVGDGPRIGGGGAGADASEEFPIDPNADSGGDIGSDIADLMDA